MASMDNLLQTYATAYIANPAIVMKNFQSNPKSTVQYEKSNTYNNIKINTPKANHSCIIHLFHQKFIIGSQPMYVKMTPNANAGKMLNNVSTTRHKNALVCSSSSSYVFTLIFLF